MPEQVRPKDDQEVFAALLGKAIKEKDDQALVALVSLLGSRRYFQRLKGYLSPIPGAHTATREDVVQETFIRFMDRVRSGQLSEVPPDVLKYVAVLATYQLRDRLRTRASAEGRESQSFTSEVEKMADTRLGGPVTQLDQKDHRKLLDQALSELPPEDCEILLLCQEDLTYREVADRVGKSEEAVRKIAKRTEARVLEKLIRKSPALAAKLREETGAPARPLPGADELRKAVAALPAELRTVIAALHFEGKPLEELAKTLGLEKAEARRDAGYEMLSMQFGGLSFPETLESAGP
jgi:RNA polymerase sigma factor (sigma-70 family)